MASSLRNKKFANVSGDSLRADEANFLAAHFPALVILLGANRKRSLTLYLKNLNEDLKRKTIVLLDDGFQHLQIKRDIDIVLLAKKRNSLESSKYL